MSRGLADHLIAVVQHVLCVVDLAGQRVPDVVQQLEDVAARHHAGGRHRQSPGFLDDGDELVEGLENPVHDRTSYG